MDPFPLLSLPQETLHKLLNRFELGELFQLSQCSRKGFDMVKTYSSSLEKPVKLIVSTGSIDEVIMYSSDFSSSLRFTFYGERNSKRLYLRVPKTYNFDGRLIDFCEEENMSQSLRFACANPHSTADFSKFTHHFKTLFNPNLYELEIFPDENSLNESLKSEWLQKSRPMTISVQEGRVTHEEMAHVLEFFDGVRTLQLMCTPGEYFSYDKIISTGHFWVDNATWIKRHNLLKFDCEDVTIIGCQLENEDLNAFLKHWLNSVDKKLKTMTIHRKRYYSKEQRKNAYKFVQEEVLKGLPTLPGAPKRQDAIIALPLLHPNTPFETGMDLRRESDGVLATVLVRDERLFGVAFTFAVWQEPDPNVVAVVP